MDFDLTQEQRLMLDSARRFVRERYDFAVRRELLAASEPTICAHWSEFAELGWLAMAVPEEFGGFDACMTDMALVLETFGNALVLEPYLSTAVLGTHLLRGGHGDRRKELLTGIATGEVRLALAAHEPAGRFDPAHTATTAEPKDGGWVLNGRKPLVLDGAAAHWFVVSARVGGAIDDPRGLALFLVPAEAAGLTVQSYRTMDGLGAADVQLVDVRLDGDALLADGDGGWELLDLALDYARVGLCAEAVGAMDQALRLAVGYIKERRQFGQPLANFQVLQHRCADMFIHADQSRSLLYQALATLDATPSERRWAVSACKVKTGEAGRFVGGEAVHLHGGNGMTDEYPVGHYLRRLLLIEKTYGDTEFHVSRCVANSVGEH